MKKSLFYFIVIGVAIGAALLWCPECTFIKSGNVITSNPPGFFQAVWHGLLAPYTLIVRIFVDIDMYAIPNGGWDYDLGFLIGICLSYHFGWLATIVAVVVLVL